MYSVGAAIKSWQEANPQQNAPIASLIHELVKNEYNTKG